MLEEKFNPIQLKKARLARGLSMSQLAKETGLSRQSISKYEMGTTNPRGDSILKIANTLKFPVNFFGKNNKEIPMGAVFFRSQAASTKKLRDMQKIRLDFAAQSISYISNYITMPKLIIPNPIDLNIKNITSEMINNLAKQVRVIWNLGNGPINNLINIMESNGILITETSMHSEKLDAVSTWVNSRPIIALTDNDESASRRRFNLAHELGHILLHFGIENIFELDNTKYKKILESQANQFASDLLLPDESYSDYLISTDMSFFKKAKLYWNVSISALIYRAYSLHLLNDNQYLYLQKQISKNKWRKHEPYDDKIKKEHPEIFYKSLKMLIDANIVSKRKISNDLGLPLEDLESMFRTDFSTENKASSNDFPKLRIIK